MVQTDTSTNPVIKSDKEGRRTLVSKGMNRCKKTGSSELLQCIEEGLSGTIVSDRMLKEAIRCAYSYFPWTNEAIGNQNDWLDAGNTIFEAIPYVLGICEQLRWDHRFD